MFPALLIIIYISLVYWWISRSNYFEIDNLSKPLIFGIFLTKVLAGFAYGYIHSAYFGGGDTFLYFKDSAQIANTFFVYPSYYFQSIIGLSPAVPLGADVFIYPPAHVFWRDLGTYSLVHIHALPQLLSFGSYNVHIVFVAVIGLIASLNIYKVFSKRLSITPMILIAACFFMPSVAFWTSGLHKDVWVYLGLSWILIALCRFSEYKDFRRTVLSPLLFGFFGIALFRYHLLILLIPAVIAYFWSILTPSKSPLSRFAIIYSLLALVLCLIQIFGFIDILEVLSNRQLAFLNEKGASNIEGVVAWTPNIWGFISFLPHAIANAAFRPFYWNCKDFLQVIAAIEISFFWLLAIASIFLKRKNAASTPISYFILFYAISNLLLIGLLVGNTGTIVRYRSVALGLLAIVVVQVIAALKIRKKNVPIQATIPSTNEENRPKQLHHVGTEEG